MEIVHASWETINEMGKTMKRISLKERIENIIFKEADGIIPEESVSNISSQIIKIISNNYRRRIYKKS